MNERQEASERQAEIDLYEEMESLIRKNPRAWQSVCAVVGLAGAILAPLLGAIFDIMTWFAISKTANSYLHVLSIVLCALPIPLLLLGASCLDLLEAKAARLSYQAEPTGSESSPAAAVGSAARRSGAHPLTRTAALAALLLLLPAAPARVYAQQTIFNVPTTDVLEPGQIYFELDASAKPNEPRFSSFVPRVVIGVGGRVELGLNVTGNVQPGPDTTTLVPTVKWKPYDGGSNGWALVFGNNLFIPVRNRPYRVGNYAYASFSKTLRAKTRLTAGGYHFTRGTVAPGAQRAGGQFGFEQPVNRKFTVQADWLTGKHSNGYFTPGVAYKLSPKLTGYFGYSLGNRHVTRGNHFFYAEAGVNFD